MIGVAGRLAMTGITSRRIWDMVQSCSQMDGGLADCQSDDRKAIKIDDLTVSIFTMQTEGAGGLRLEPEASG